MWGIGKKFHGLLIIFSLMACTSGNLPSKAKVAKPIIPKNETCYLNGNVPQPCKVYRNERGVIIKKIPLKDLGKNEAGRSINSPLPIENLNDWVPSGPAKWSQAKHQVSAKGSAPGFLLSLDAHSNFQLTVSFRVGKTTNSGIFIRCQNREDINPDTCYEMNIWDHHPNQEFRTGSIVKHVSPETHVNTLGQWNQYKVVAKDDSLDVYVNGKKTAQLVDSGLLRGFIALQFAEQGFVEFKDLSIQTLGD